MAACTTSTQRPKLPIGTRGEHFSAAARVGKKGAWRVSICRRGSPSKLLVLTVRVRTYAQTAGSGLNEWTGKICRESHRIALCLPGNFRNFLGSQFAGLIIDVNV